MLCALMLGLDSQVAISLAKDVLPQGADTLVCLNWEQAVSILRRRDQAVDLVIVAPSGRLDLWLGKLQLLVEAAKSRGYSPGPRFIAILGPYRGPEFELRLEQLGVRFLYG